MADVVTELKEDWTQSEVRLRAPRVRLTLWRNNVGVLRDANGRPVRFGLANDTKALNDILKSGDLIGWRPVTITPDMVGKTIAQFVSLECKRPGWTFTGTEREVAQRAWGVQVTNAGGYAAFVSDPDDILRLPPL